MDKITHQVRAEHWTRILNECMNSGMPKTAWCRANGVSEKQFCLYGKGTDSFFFTKGWNWAASAGPVQKKRLWRSRRNNTGR